jgi:cytochrome bd-type quinol oxidase subunit 2
MGKKLAVVGLALSLALLLAIGIGSAYNGYTDEEALGALACLSGTMCILPVIWLIVAIALAVWVYKDAEARGESGVLWLIVCALLGVIGFIIWLIVRPKEKKV